MLDNPIFFLGMPRSGTTVVFEAFAKSTPLGWLSNYTEMWPTWPVANLLCPLLDNKLLNLRGNKKQYGKVVFGNRYLPQPVEAYNFWDHYSGRNFSRDYMLGVKAKPEEVVRIQLAVGRVLRYQIKKRLVTKLTGPGRVEYLSSVFPNATFVHLVRDGRAVVHSLMNVGFWKEKGGFEAPFWQGGLSDVELDLWHKKNNDPAMLCAMQWNKVVQTIQQECYLLNEDNYLVVKYEDYITDPQRELKRIAELTNCPSINSVISTIGNGASIVNMNDKYKQTFSAKTISLITDVMKPMLKEFDYIVEGDT